MKRSVLFLSLAVLAFACKKKDKNNDFTATDVTGTTVVKGTLSKNIITPNGAGGWTSNTRIPAAGVNVSVKVNKSSLYPNSTAQGADVYSATTDNKGNYSISVRSNASGVNAVLTIDGFNGTLDTVMSSQTFTGFYSIYAGTSQSLTLFMGQNTQFDYGFVASPVVTNPNNNLNTGVATITGSVGVNFIKEVTTGTLITLTTTNVPVDSRIVYLSFSNDPATMATKQYTTTTNSSGYYTFEVKTVAPGTPGFNQSAVIWVADYAATRDTLKANNTVKTGRPGVFAQQTRTQAAVFNNSIKNANNFIYNAFTPD